MTNAELYQVFKVGKTKNHIGLLAEYCGPMGSIINNLARCALYIWFKIYAVALCDCIEKDELLLPLTM